MPKCMDENIVTLTTSRHIINKSYLTYTYCRKFIKTLLCMKKAMEKVFEIFWYKTLEFHEKFASQIWLKQPNPPC
jgi:hypothetical protein